MDFKEMFRDAIKLTTRMSKATQKGVMIDLAVIEIKHVKDPNPDIVDPQAMKAWFRLKGKIIEHPGSLYGCKLLLKAIDEVLREEGVEL